MQSLLTEGDPEIHEVTLYADQEQIALARSVLNRGRVCVACKEVFQYKNSLGRMQCKMHIDFKGDKACKPVKSFDRDREQFRWSCCGQYDPKIVFEYNHDIFGRFDTNIKSSPFYTRSGIGMPEAVACVPCDHRTTNDLDALQPIDVRQIAAILPELTDDLLGLKGFDKERMRIHRFQKQS